MAQGEVMADIGMIQAIAIQMRGLPADVTSAAIFFPVTGEEVKVPVRRLDGRHHAEEKGKISRRESRTQ
jgi:hypothetical protein